eukprot:566507-Amphidinium_carterae.1
MAGLSALGSVGEVAKSLAPQAVRCGAHVCQFCLQSHKNNACPKAPSRSNTKQQQSVQLSANFSIGVAGAD